VAVVSQLPPEQVEVLTKEGRLSPIWRRFLESLWRRTGGFDDAPSGAQPRNDNLDALSGVIFGANQTLYATGPGAFLATGLTVFGRSLIDDADAAAARATLGLGSLATAATVNNTNWSGPQLSVGNGGTGATDAATARTNLGLGTAATQNTGTFLLAANNLSDVTAATARANLGLGSLAQLSTVNNGNWSGADLAIANGGTGASDAATARSNLGLGALATQSAVTVAQLPTPPTFSASRNTSQNIASGSFVKVQCATEAWDVGSCYDNATNHRFMPNVAGKYLVTGAVNINILTASTLVTIASIFKNGAEHKRGSQVLYAVTGGGSNHAPTVSALVELNGSTDYVELFAFQNSGATETISGGSELTWFQAVFVSP
jgi:hypothetical protein